MPRPFRILLPVGLLCLLAVALSACGGGSSDKVPGNAVAKVGDVSITKDQFNHWITVAAKSTAAQSGATGATSQAPVPPTFTACIAAAKATAAKTKGAPKQTDAQYKATCQQTYNQLRDSVVSFLVTSQWLEQEANDRKITVTDATVNKDLTSLKKQQFPKAADYQTFLKQQGMTNADVLFRLKLQSLETKLQTQVTKGKDKVTSAQIAQYYAKNKARFSTPETRDVHIVLTKQEATAQTAKRALQSGDSWSAVAKKYSIDSASKKNGGKLTGVAKGQQEKALDTALFGAKKGQLGGPVKTQFGWYVYEVDTIKPATQQTQAQANTTIKQMLASQGQQSALTKFVNGFQKKWKAQTTCRTGFVTQDCSNAPKTTSTATTAAAPTTTTTPAAG
jgi:foldase protein PrsA